MNAPEPMRCLVNPASGRGAGGRFRPRVVELAERAGAPVRVTRSAEDLAAEARRAAEDGVERLVVVGGDGAMHHAVRGLAGSRCALAMIPVGSGNDLATNVDVPKSFEEAAGLAFDLRAPTRLVDLGAVRPAGAPTTDPTVETPFAIYCGVGFDSEVTRVANRVRRLRGPVVYPYATVRTLVGFRPPVLRVEHDEGVFEGRAMFVTVANAPTFGGGMRIAPQAVLDDGLFDIVIVRRVPKWELLTIFPKVYSGRHVGHPAVRILRTRRALLTAVDRPLAVYGDGEELLPLPAGAGAEVSLRPKALRVVTRQAS